MKRLTLILALTVNCALSYGQDIYESSADSYRTQFLLMIAGDRLVLYGWELTEKVDTLTYKASGCLSNDNNVTLDNYQVSKLSPSKINWDQFQPDSASISPYFLYRHLNIKMLDRGRLEVLMTKDAYDSRLDKFVFVRRK